MKIKMKKFVLKAFELKFALTETNSLSTIGVFICLSKLPLSANGVFLRLPRFRELTEAGQTLLI